ncbi:hypothetical protein [Streptomyces sp. JNUCC 63]
MSGTALRDNTAARNGGGIANDDLLPVTHTHIFRNTAQTGGGICNNQGTMTLQDNAVTENTPDNCRTSPPQVPGCSV